MNANTTDTTNATKKPFVHKDYSGSLFNNTRRQSDDQPERTGSATINGVQYYINAWTKQNPKGSYWTLSFKKKEGNN